MAKDEHSIEDIFNLAGKDLTTKMLDIFMTEKNALEWFYKPNKALGEKKPYDLCIEERFSDLETILGRIEYSIPP
ncbi:MAG: antitoxin Xre/MbcA/ParS toxin-binding domain-containing protein [Candidatus Woesearchaeota archaeon]